MYLLAFATVLIGLMGLYAQVMVLQTSQILARQAGLAPAMLMWQAAAVSVADGVIGINGPGAVTATGCSLTYALSATLANCPTPITGGTTGTVTNATNVLNLVYNPATTYNICANLPSKCTAMSGNNCTACTVYYDTGDYQFNSVLFQSSTGQAYVITYAAPPTVVGVPSGVNFNVSMGTLMQQLKNTGTANFSYGYIVSTGTTANLVIPVNNYTIPLPAMFNPTTFNGGVAVIGTP